jgi:hypothetical protein
LPLDKKDIMRRIFAATVMCISVPAAFGQTGDVSDASASSGFNPSGGLSGDSVSDSYSLIAADIKADIMLSDIHSKEGRHPELSVSSQKKPVANRDGTFSFFSKAK